MKKSIRSKNGPTISKRATKASGKDGRPEPERRQFLSYMTPDLIMALKIEAMGQGRHAYELVEDAVRGYLKARGSLTRSV